MKTTLLFLFTFLFFTAKSQNPEAVLSINVSVTSNDWCGFGNGAATSFVSGGVPPYTYQWDNGATSAAISSVMAGSYMVTVTDSTGATAVSGALIENITQPQYYIIAINQPHVGLNDGKIYTGLYPNISGGAIGFPDGNYDFILYDASFNIVDSQTVICSGGVFGGDSYFDVINLSPGVYSLMCGYMGGCSTTYGFELKEIPDIIPTFTSSASCNGTPTGKVFANLHQNPSINGGTFNMNITGGLSNMQRVLQYEIRLYDTGGTLVKKKGTKDSLVMIPDVLPGNYDIEIWTINEDAFNVEHFDSLHIYSGTLTVQNDTTCSVVAGNVFADYNSNCVQNSGDIGLSNVIIELNPGGVTAVTDANGAFYFPIQTGTYTLTQYAPFGYEQLCPDTATFVINNTTPGSIFNVAVADSVTATPDVRISMIAGTPRPGFDQHFSISYYNITPALIPATTVSFSYDTSLSFVSATPAPTTNSGGLITWNTATLSAFGHRNFSVVLNVPASTSIGTIVQSSVSVLPAPGETNLANNTDTIIQLVSGSFDPNDIAVSPQGYPSEGYITNQEVLKYTVNFQNTGNDTAFNVMIVDSLPASLDRYSVQLLNASHLCTYEITSTNVLIFHLNNLLLPDSNVNEEASHGYIKYSISQVANNTPGTVIDNEADIYFDFNAPITTNTVRNTIYDCSSILSAGLNSLFACEGDVVNGSASLLFPATLQWTVDSVFYSADTTVAFNLPAGTHSITAMVLTNMCASSSSFQLTVHPLPQPTFGQNVYYLYSSYPAGNQWYFGGVAIPGATDSTYTILQNGYYYVEVTDSNNCTGVSDSLFIIVTSIPSPDVDQMLSVLPNPATEHIVLRGKKLPDEIIIMDAYGRRVLHQTVAGSVSEINIDISMLAKGIYFITSNEKAQTLILVKQ